MSPTLSATRMAMKPHSRNCYLHFTAAHIRSLAPRNSVSLWDLPTFIALFLPSPTLWPRLSGNSPGLTGSIFLKPLTIIELATKLWEPTLFRECAIHLMPRYEEIGKPLLILSTNRGVSQLLCIHLIEHLLTLKFPTDDPKIRRVVRSAHNELCASVMSAQGIIYNNTGNQSTNGSREVSNHWQRATLTGSSPVFMEGQQFSMPALYRLLSDSKTWKSPQYLRFLLRKLLANNLVFDRDAILGEGEYWNHFLCGKIEDSELPWDTTETDWWLSSLSLHRRRL